MILEYSSFGLGYNFSSCYYNVFSTDFAIPSPWMVSYIIYPPLDDLELPFVDCPGHYLSVCPIKHLPQPLVSWGSQGSNIQRSFSHKCSQEVWWDALNVVVATIPSVTSGLTPSPKLFFYSMISSGNVPLTWPYCPSM